MRLIETHDRYEAESTYDERTIPKAAGFRWDPSSKVWYTTYPDVAANLIQYADSGLKARILEAAEEREKEKQVVKLTLSRDRFELICHFDNRHIPKDAGFRWDGDNKAWYTEDAGIASGLLKYADDLALAAIKGTIQKEALSVEQSHLTDAEVDIPHPPGLEYRPFQKAGIDYAINHPNCLIADEPGLGKTIQALGVVNYDPTADNVLVICPASLKLNWEREAKRWLVRDTPVTVINGTKATFPSEGFVILNYELLSKYRSAIDQVKWDVLIFDESHMLKNDKAARTIAALGRWNRDPSKRTAPIKAKRRLFLTGTPILNKPIEIWTTIHSLDPATWGSWKAFTEKHCDARETRWGWDVNGASNLTELQDRLRSRIMVRRLKSEVMTELPPKQRQVIVLPSKSSVKKREKEYIETLEEMLKDAMRKGIDIISSPQFEHMSQIRHKTALDKVPDAIDHIKALMDEHQKLVVMCHHRDVLEAIYEGVSEFGAVRLQGGDSEASKQDAIDRFQNDPSVRIFLGSIRAAGVGITLTAASLLLFVELDWVPGIMTQAEDRIHRIGAVGSVLIQHLVFADSIDARMAEAIVEKQGIIEQALD
jgi:SWI/SNF-related matrix-associated actin-dependent regulator 1 of chromatin subfamily A